MQFSRPFVEGMIARLTGDDSKALSAFTEARAEQEKILQTQPDYGPPLCVLGLIDAPFGRKEDACAKASRAIQVLL